MRFWISLLGWVGAFAALIAYGLISNNKVTGDSQFFQWLNLTGGIVLLINTAYNEAYPAALVNVVWTTIAMFALVKIWRSRGIEHPEPSAE